MSQTQNVYVTSEKGEFKISGRKVLFDGFYKVYGELDKDKILPNLKKGRRDELAKHKKHAKLHRATSQIL